MRKLLLIITALICCVSAHAQVSSQRVIYTTANPPTSCAPGKIYSNATTHKIYQGSSVGGCTDVTGGAAGTVTTSGSPASPQLAKFSSGTAITTATATDVSTPQFCADAGSTDTYACDLAPAIASYVVGTKLRFFANTANTGAASINFNSVGALTLVKVAGGITTALATNDIRSGQWVDCTIATGSNCQVTSLLGNAGGVGGDTGATDNILLRSDGTGGATLQNSAVTVDDTTGALNGPTNAGYFGANVLYAKNYFHVAGNILGTGSGTGSVDFLVEMAAQRKVMGVSTTLFGWSSGAGDTASSFRDTMDTNINRSSAGVVRFGTTTANGSGSFIASSGTLTALASDAATTNNTVCVTTTTGVLRAGSGANGVCLGTSSARYKHDIFNLTDGLSVVRRLQPKRFFFNQGYGNSGAKESVGFLAEDVVRVAPRLVDLDSAGQPNTVDMMAMVPMLVNSIRELNAKVDAQAKEIRKLKRQLHKR